MPDSALTVLIVGATGSVGRYVVDECLHQGYTTRALVRDSSKAASLPAGVETVVGDLTSAESLGQALEGVDAVVFTHGFSTGGKEAAEAIDYGAVRHALFALQGRSVRIALMTSIGITNRKNIYNQSSGILDWKRRSERLLRASGQPYTIVRPGWFDYNGPDELNLVLLQGDTRNAGNPGDGVISRKQIAEVLVRSLISEAALGKTFELIATAGPASTNLDELFDALSPDVPDVLDGIRGLSDMPLGKEPQRIQEDLEALTGH